MRISVGGARTQHLVRLRGVKALDWQSGEAHGRIGSPGKHIDREKPQSFETPRTIRIATEVGGFEAKSENVSAEAEAAYNALMVALDDANYMIQRVALAYGTSLAHLQECRFESSAALGILAQSNRAAGISAPSPAPGR